MEWVMWLIFSLRRWYLRGLSRIYPHIYRNTKAEELLSKKNKFSFLSFVVNKFSFFIFCGIYILLPLFSLSLATILKSSFRKMYEAIFWSGEPKPRSSIYWRTMTSFGQSRTKPRDRRQHMKEKKNVFAASGHMPQ